MKRFAAITLAAAATAVPATAARQPTATASLNKPEARWAIRHLIRQNENERRGSIAVGNCRKGYTSVGRRRILCDIYFETTDSLSGRCGWGRVVQMRTFKRVEYKTRRC